MKVQKRNCNLEKLLVKQTCVNESYMSNTKSVSVTKWHHNRRI